MNPNYVDTITVYHNTGSEWTRSVIERVFWNMQDAEYGYNDGGQDSNTFLVRIPAKPGQYSFEPGDIIVNGICTMQITNKSPNTSADLLAKLGKNAFRCNRAKDNTRYAAFKHWKLEGGSRNEY